MAFRRIKNYAPIFKGARIPNMEAVSKTTKDGVKYVIFEDVSDEQVAKRQLPHDVDITTIIQSGQLIEPSTINVLNPTDKNTIESAAHDYASNVAFKLSEEIKNNNQPLNTVNNED